jgi:diacylglycerol kinase family enzyme
MLRYRPARVRLWVDERELGEYSITNVCVCNGRFAGGGMMFAPAARLGDGLFDVVVMREATLAQALALSGKIYEGRHVESPLVTVVRGRRVRAETVTADPAWVDIDGEAPGVLPVEARVLPGALRLIDPWADVV